MLRMDMPNALKEDADGNPRKIFPPKKTSFAAFSVLNKYSIKR